MKLKDDVIDSLKPTEYLHPSQIFQSTIKGRKVAVKVIRLYVPRKVDEPLTVSTELCIRELRLNLFMPVTWMQRFCKEAVAWRHLRHPNILPLLGAMLDDHRLCLVSEWMDQGNINDYLRKRQHSEVNRIELVGHGQSLLLDEVFEHILFVSWWKSLMGYRTCTDFRSFMET